MSIKVEIAQLGHAMAEHDFAYLLSPGRERPHVVALVPRLVGGALVLDSPGRSALTLAASHPAVTLVFPPRAASGYTLIVDGVAELPEGEPGDGAGYGLTVTPSSAILHRPAVRSS
ncbi:pyridoxamine 5'-phosphate oxidase family protein [Georgenia yuyongxinii]|uniref:Pyridoxamine 5'-phosphate oxidase family protein n=1 Tax=Georgenia yuyongxinii TaxID=2589797 RepID=A0A552WTE2_9MICO|nr:pyridoxamine 5'-phosphate oxidase family protein [Georgenia yuyongxinii]TRW46111.1 pyridoxamine 5'-phosphate oxidase family protein [Georgenia yuyongxinii]